MFEKILVTSLLALALVATGTQAQTSTAGAPQPAVEAVDPGAVQALKDMGAYLQTLRRFEVSTDLTGERVLADGQKLQHAASAVMQVERPNRLRAAMKDVPDATDADAIVAERLLASGEVRTEKAAMSLAVFQRMQATRKPGASEEARRRASGLQAGQLSGSRRRGGDVEVPVPTNMADVRAIYKQQAEHQKNASQG